MKLAYTALSSVDPAVSGRMTRSLLPNSEVPGPGHADSLPRRR